MDIIHSLTKLDIQENSLLVLRVAEVTEQAPLQIAVEKLSEWLLDHNLDRVQIIIVAGHGFDVGTITNEDMNKLGWFRKDDL